MEIEWKDVLGYEGLYKVSNTGKVMDSAGNEVKQVITKSYRKEVRLRGGTTKYNSKVQAKGKKVHRLVAESFLGLTYPSGLDVDHINSNPTDNRLNNLRLATKQENTQAYTENKYKMASLQKYRNEDKDSVPLEEFKGYEVTKEGIILKEGKPIRRNNTGTVSIDHDTYKVHRIVASAYLVQPYDNCNIYVHHIDRDKSNNHYKNLFFCPVSLFRYTMKLQPEPLKLKRDNIITDNKQPEMEEKYYCYSCNRRIVKDKANYTIPDLYASLDLTRKEMFHLMSIINSSSGLTKERQVILDKLGNPDNYLMYNKK